jgi:hypothetical protein
MQAEHVVDGQQPMNSFDVVSKVLCLYQGKRPSQASSKNLFLKNVGILRSSTRAETSAEMTLQEQLAGEQENTSELVELVDEIKVRTEKAKRELEEFNQQQQEEEEFNQQQQEEYNRLCEVVLRLSSPSN